MSPRPIECGTGVDLDRAVEDGRMSLSAADAVRAFARFVEKAPKPTPGHAFTREELVQYRAALVEYDEAEHRDVIEKIDRVLEEADGA